MERRDFLKAALALTVLPAWPRAAGGARRPPGGGPIPRRRLGSTGEAVSVIGLGGFHLGIGREEEALRMVRTALDAGVSFLDNCWDYNGGESERRVGKALRDGYRDKAFVMTKIDGRSREKAARQIDESLQRFGLDGVDLIQLHEVIRGSDPQRAFEDGAIETLVEARQAGKTRFIGFTGHKSPEIHLAMLDAAAAHGFRFDTVQMPLNVLDAHHDSFERRVLPRLVKEGIGMLGMKPLADGRIPELGLVPAEDALRYAMSLPVSVTITGCEAMERVEQALRVAGGFEPLSEAEVAALLQRTRGAGTGGGNERYKTSTSYDGTTQNPQWL